MQKTNKRKAKKSSPNSKSDVSSVRMSEALFPYRRITDQDIMPPTITRRLNYIDSSINRNNAGVSYLLWQYRLNSAYDPDPLILTGGISGFSELAALYREYRVKSVQVETTICNKENFPITYGIVFSNTNIAPSIVSVSTALDFLENGFSTRIVGLSPVGGLDQHHLETTISLPDLLGDPGEYNSDRGYASLNNTNPSVFLYANFIVVGSANFVNGVSQFTSLRMNTKFFNRQSNIG